MILGIDDIDRFRSEREKLVYDQGDRVFPEYYSKEPFQTAQAEEGSPYAASVLN